MNFKKICWIFSGLFLLGNTHFAGAQIIKDVFSSPGTPLFYLGVDFTLTRAIDAPELASDIRDRHFPAINSLLVNEPKKYDLAAAFHKTQVDHDLSIVDKRNAKINIEEIRSGNSGDYNRLQEKDIKNLVSSWDFAGKKGIGLMIVMEGLSKAQKGASMWITLVDMSSKQLLMTERMTGKTGMAFGFRNYWANPIREVIEEIEKKMYKTWKAKYAA